MGAICYRGQDIAYSLLFEQRYFGDGVILLNLEGNLDSFGGLLRLQYNIAVSKLSFRVFTWGDPA